MRAHRVRALLMGGQACVFYGAAEFSRDTAMQNISTSLPGRATLGLRKQKFIACLEMTIHSAIYERANPRSRRRLRWARTEHHALRGLATASK
jgi:hypothetical protein